MRALAGTWGRVAIVMGLVGCAGSQQEPAAAPEASTAAEALPAEGAAPLAESAAPAASAPIEVQLQPKSGSQLAGGATLSEAPEGVKVQLSVENVPPGDHGAHVHENGDCSAPDGSSAGGHFNPGGQPHALPASSPRHLGDLGNIHVGADGKGTLEIVAAGANLKEGDPSSFRGRAIIIHEKPDDGGQPTGNAGGRIGCAVIE